MVESKKLTILPYYKDVENLYNNLSDKAMDELECVSRAVKISPLNILRNDISKSGDNCWSFFYGWDLLGCGGYFTEKELEKGFGTVWVLNTKAAEKYKISYVKAIKRTLEYAKIAYNKGIYLTTKEDYKEANNLNKSLGFKPISKIDLCGNNFIIYLLKREDY